MHREVIHKSALPPVVCVSGGFDPIHVGHVRLLQEAAEYGTLLVIVNNDNWMKRKKGFVFMPEIERLEVIFAIRGVYHAYLSFHEPETKDMTVCRELEFLQPDIFCQGGDRTEDNNPEKTLCEELGIEIIYNVGGGKIQSSSWLVEKAGGACRKVIEL